MNKANKTIFIKADTIKQKHTFKNVLLMIFLILFLSSVSFSVNAAPDGYCQETISDFHVATWVTNVDYDLLPNAEDPEAIKITVDVFFTTDGFGLAGFPCQPDPECNEDFRYVNAWIDWDGDQIFDPEEQVLDEELFWYDESYQNWLINNYEGDPLDLFDIILLPRENFTGKSIRWFTFDSFAGGMGIMTVTKIIPMPDSYRNDTWMRVNYGWLYNPQTPCELFEPTGDDPYTYWEYGDATYKQISTTPDLSINASDIIIKPKSNTAAAKYDLKNAVLTVKVHNKGKTTVKNVDVLMNKQDGSSNIATEIKTITSIPPENYVNISFEGNFDPYRFETISIELDPENTIWESSEKNNKATTNKIEGIIVQYNETLSVLPKTRVDIEQKSGTDFKNTWITFTDEEGFYKVWTNTQALKEGLPTRVNAKLDYSPIRNHSDIMICVINESDFGDNKYPNDYIANNKSSTTWILHRDKEFIYDICYSGIEGGLAYQTLITVYTYHEKLKTAPAYTTTANINDDDYSDMSKAGPYVYGHAIHLPPGKAGTTRPSAIGHEFTHIVEYGWLPTHYGHHPLVPVEEGSCHWGSCISRNTSLYEFPSRATGGYVIIDISKNNDTCNSTPAPATSVGCREEFQIAGTMWSLNNTTLIWNVLRYGYGPCNPLWPSTPLLFYNAYKEIDTRSSPTIKGIFQSHAYNTSLWPGKDGQDPDYFTEIFSDQGVDADSDGKYETLQVTVELNMSAPGNYLLTGVIGGTDVGSSNTTSLEYGVQLVNLSFFGENIYESQQDGPYNLSFYLYDEDYTFLDIRTAIYDTQYYSYTEFERPTLLFTGNQTAYGTDSDGDGIFDQLIVDLELNLTESSYVKMYANLYSNDAFIDNCWGPSMYDDAVYEYLESGVQHLLLYFNGESIYASGLNGSYELRTYLSNARTLQLGSFNYTDFAQPPALIGDLIEESGIDEDGDGFYDTLNVNISVNGLGTYSLSGHLYNETGAHIITTHQTDDINLTQSILLSFDGKTIRDQQRSGVYTLSVELYDMNGFFLGWKNYTLSMYDHTDFEPSSDDIFEITCNDYGIDSNGHSGYEELCIDLDITSLLPGMYDVEGYLCTANGEIVCFDETMSYLDETVESLTLLFDGQQLGSTLYNGSYTLDLVFTNSSGIIELEQAYSTTYYSYDFFESSYVLNTTDKLYSYGGSETVANRLGVTAEIYSTIPRYVTFKARLLDSTGELIAESRTGDIWAYENDTALILFDGGKIYDHGIDGPYTVILRLYDEDENLLDIYTGTTNYYDHSLFSLVTLTDTYTDYGIDLNSDTVFDYLVIEADVHVSTDGFCTITGTLEDVTGETITISENTLWLPEGLQILPLYFNGSEIKNHGVNGPYYLKHVVVSHNADVTITDYVVDAYVTSVYDYTDFTLSASIPPNQKPVSIASGPKGGTTGESLFFNGSASYDPEGQSFTYLWEFGDGTTSILENPAYTYSTDGIYTVNLTVNDGMQNSYPKKLIVSIGYPVADTGGPYTVYGIQPLTFNSSASFDPEEGPLTYSWEFGDGSISTEANPTYTYATEGVYTVSLTVHDETYEATASTTVTVLKSLFFEGEPIDEGYDEDGDGLYEYLLVETDVTNYVSQTVSAEVTLTDSFGTILSYGLDTEYLNISSYKLSIYFDGPTFFENMVDGPYFVEIVIRDENNEILDSLNYATQSYGYADFQYNTKIDTVSDEGIDTNSNGTFDFLSVNVTLINYVQRDISLSGTLLDSNGTLILNLQESTSIDGNTTIQFLFDGPTIFTHREHGPYTVVLNLKNQYDQVIDNKQHSTFAYQYTDFEEPSPVNLPPITEANGAYRADSGQDIQFNSSGSYDPEDQPLTYLWNFSDGNTSTDANPIHAYISTERMKLYPELNVSDGVHSDTDTATVYINYPVAISGGPYYATEGTSIQLDGSASYDPLEEPYQSYPIQHYWYPANGDSESWRLSSKKDVTYDTEGEYHPYLWVKTNTGYPYYYSEYSYTTVFVNDTDPIPDFSSSQQNGVAPLTIDFMDQSDSYDGITLWEWDFDGDGITDAAGTDDAARNPSFTYLTAGSYTVNLTVYEADGDMVSMIKTDYIIVNTPRPPITIYVPDDYPSIQEAIDAGTTMDRDTIIVRDGVYKQNTLVNKELIIRSENGSEYCQLFPEIPLNHHMITIISDNVTIDGFFMNGTRSWYDEPGSIYVNEVDNVTICNNWINDSSHGIVLENAHNITIMNNAISNNDDEGIYGYEYYSDNEFITIIGNNLSHNKGSGLWLCGDYHLISNNTVNNNTGYGLRLCGDYHLISNNTVNNNGGGIECSNYNEIIGNTINNNWDGLRIISGNGNIISNNTMNSNHHHGLFLDGAYNIVHDNIMQENTVYDLYTQYNNNVYLNTGSGNRPIIYANETIIIENMVISSLILVDADYSLIKNVTVAGSETLRNNGIYARSCDYVEFINVTSNHNYQGIDMTPAVYFVLVGQEDNIFTDCSFKDNRRDGVRIGGDRNKIENCDISFNQNYGVYFYEFSKDSSIVNSTLNNNSWKGIHLRVGYTRFHILNNTINGGSSGIYCGNGNYIGITPSNVTIAYNTISNNTNDAIHLNDGNRRHGYLIHDNVLKDNVDCGLFILVQYCTFEVFNNTITGNDEGISCENTYWDENAHVNITYNTILDNNHGIGINKINDHPNNYLISDNIIEYNAVYGIYISPVSGTLQIVNNSIIGNANGIYCNHGTTTGITTHVTIGHNTISDNDDAINITDKSISHNYLIHNTIIENNAVYGIFITSVSGTLQIVDNMITENNDGIYCENSICDANAQATIIHNIISHNNNNGIRTNDLSIQFLIYDNIIVNNSVHDIAENSWNITKTSGPNIIGGPYIGGNYWSDYAGVDLDGDFLGDTDIPFNASGKITTGGDHHPLVMSQELYLLPIQDQMMYEDTIRSVPVCALGTDTNAIVLSVDGLPSFGVFSDEGNGIGIIDFMPDSGDKGEYMIIINATDGINTATESFNLLVLATDYLPVASYIFEPQTPTTLQTIYFNSTSTDPDGALVNWTWDMGDGTHCYGEQIQHQYTAVATYEACLTVEDNNGFTDTTCQSIVVEAPFIDVGVNTILSPEDGDEVGIIPVQIEVQNYGNTYETDIIVNVKIGNMTGDPITLLAENFSSLTTGEIPTNWTRTHVNWGAIADSHTGGSSPEMRFNWNPDAIDIFRLSTYPIDTVGYTTLEISFKHFLNHYDVPYTLHVQSSTDGANWSDVWSVDPTGDIGPETINISLDAGDGVGSDTFYLAWAFGGDSYNVDYWYIDDILVLTPPASVNVYNQTINIDLSFGEQLIVDSFPDWTGMTAGYYYVETCVQIPGDVNPDNNCLFEIIQVNSTSGNQPPIADAGGPYTAQTGEDITLDGSGSTDPDGTIIAYYWDLDNDGQYDDASGAQPTILSSSGIWLTPGTYTITLQVKDDQAATDTNQTTIQITTPNQPPIADAGGPYYGLTGDNIQLNASGSSDNDGFIVVYDWDLDNDGQYDDASGVTLLFSWLAAGSYPVSLRVTDDGGTNDTDDTTVEITASNQLPVAVNDSYVLFEDSTLLIAEPGILGNDSDGDMDSLFATLLQSTSHGVLILYNNGSFTYTPDENYSGFDGFTYTASDGADESNIAIVNITISPINDAPNANDDSFTVLEDSGDTIFDVLDNDMDVEDDSLLIESVTQSVHGTATNNGNNITYTSHTDYCGPDSFTYTISDGNGGIDTAMVTVMVTCVNDPPTAYDDVYTVAEDSSNTILSVLENDDIFPDTGETLSIVSVDTPNNGGIISIIEGIPDTLSYTPAPDFFGIESFNYTVTDEQGGFDTAPVTITVTAVNDPSVAYNDSYTLQENSMLIIPEPGILGNDTDVDLDFLTAVLATSPSNGTLLLNSNGSFSYEPDTHFEGIDSFTYQANDGSTYSNIATVYLIVQPVNTAPVLAPITDLPVDENDTVTVLISASDADDDTLTLSALGVPSFAVFIDNGDGSGSIVFTPGFNDAGVYKLTLTVSDGILSDSTVFNITVNNVNRPPLIPSNPTPLNEALDCDVNTDLSWIGGDPDSDDAVTYDVYFGETNRLSLLVNNQTDVAYDPGTLDPGMTFYWQVISWDNHDGKTEGPIWNFTTVYAAEISIQKTVSLDNISWHDAVIVESDEVLYWNITVENTGDVLLLDVMVTDDLFTTYDVFPLACNEKRSFYYTMISSTDLNNTASVEGTDPYGNIIRDTDWASVFVTVAETIDLEISKTASLDYASDDEYEGLSHGFWKNHEEEWVGYLPSDMTGDIFDIPDELSSVNDTLRNALQFKGGNGVEKAAKLLMVQSVAALLNTAHPYINYPFSESALISNVTDALASLNRQTMLSLKDTLDEYNNLGGDLKDCCKSTVCTITYIITLNNNGSTDATGINVTDILPENLTYISSEATLGSYDVTTGIWNVGFLQAYGNSYLEIVVETNVSGSYSNTAEVTYANEVDSDSIPNNHDASEDDQDIFIVEVILGDDCG
jgi:uncharacterized repeat protein (TIGR01451 family)